ncbi:MAG: Error-prone polymerase [Planctomycetota bacterium]
MPDQPPPKHVLHPALRCGGDAGDDAPDGATASFPRARWPRDIQWGELLVQSSHSFLSGASHPEELVEQAVRLGHAGIALTDIDSVGGAVRAHVAARDGMGAGNPLKLAHGARTRLLLETPASLSASPSDAPFDEPSDEPSDGQPSIELALYASSRSSWGALCRLLSHRGLVHGDSDDSALQRRGKCPRTLHELIGLLRDHPGGSDLLAVLIPPSVPDQSFLEAAEGLASVLTDERLAVAMHRTDDAEGVLAAERACVLADALGVSVVATGDVRMHCITRKPLLDTLACIRAGTSIQRARDLLAPNAERRLKLLDDVLRRYADRPEALHAAWRFLDRASRFSLAELRYEYPEEVVPPEFSAQGWTAMEYLKSITWKGARERYPRGIPPKVARQLEHEFAIIDDLRYAPYFLTVHEIVAFARSRGILCQGRGAAANSAVCFALGVTAVDPDRIDVLFERFVSRERNEPPDIDIDFEHERREEVIQHIYAKYGRDRAALVCEVISYRGRSAVRDVGKALGFAADAVDRVAREVDRWGGGGLGTRDELIEEHAAAIAEEGKRASQREDARDHPLRPLPQRSAERMRAAGLDPASPLVIRYARLVDEILGFPRHRSQHVGGFIISRTPLLETVPIEHAAMDDRTIIEWDKDDVEALGMLKIDVLSLGMLTAVRKAIDLVNADRTAIEAGASPFRTPDAPTPRSDLLDVSPAALTATGAAVQPTAAAQPAPLRFHAIPAEDQDTYDMICKADTIGVFQIESRAQMSMLPRLKPRCFYDLVIEVAIVRPGPIQGDMVHPYLRRRSGEEYAEYPDEAVQRVLGRTLGVPLFQEQAMALAVVAAGFTPGQADELRRAIAAWKRQGNRIAQFGEALESGMLARGYSRKFASQVFEQIKGFSGYGFPESHAASFALLVYASAWLKRHHPAAFAAALLNSQPMGFYAPAQIIRDAKDHGVAVRAVDVHCSKWDATLERGIDLAVDLAQSSELRHASERRQSVPASGERSCRRTQRQLDESYLRMRVRHPHVRLGSGGVVETWGGSSAGCHGQAHDARWRPCPGQLQPSRVPGEIPSERTFVRLHSQGRSVTTEGSLQHAWAEPLCAPARDGDQAPPRFDVPSQPAIRLGLRMVRGLDVDEAHRIIDAVVRHGAFASISDLHDAAGVSPSTLRRLAAADAFASMGLDRQQATWQILALRDRERPLWSFPSQAAGSEALSDAPSTAIPVSEPATPSIVHQPDIEPNLPTVEELAGIAKDLDATGVSLKRHPMACLRQRLAKAGAVPCGWLRDERRLPSGRSVAVAGLVLVRQRPSTAKGIVFMTLEDETGVANLIFRPKVYERLRTRVRDAPMLCVRGKVERRDGVVHVLVRGVT